MPKRLEEIMLDRPDLSRVAQGYLLPDLVGDSLFPVARELSRWIRMPVFGKEAFIVRDNRRAIRTDVGRLDFGVTYLDQKLEEHALEALLDKEELKQSQQAQDPNKALLNLEVRRINVVTQSLRVERENLQAVLAQDDANYPAGNKVTLAGATQWTNAASTPLTDIETAREKIREKAGAYPNLMVLGALAYKALRNHATLIEKIKYSMKGVLTADLIAEITNISSVIVGQSVKQDEVNDKFVDLWSDNAILAYVGTGQNKEEPSFGYTFEEEGFPQVQEYEVPRARSGAYQEALVYLPAITLSGAGYIIKDTNA